MDYDGFTNFSIFFFFIRYVYYFAYLVVHDVRYKHKGPEPNRKIPVPVGAVFRILGTLGKHKKKITTLQ